MENEVNLKVHQQQLLHYTTPPDGALISLTSLFFFFFCPQKNNSRQNRQNAGTETTPTKNNSQGALVGVAATYSERSWAERFTSRRVRHSRRLLKSWSSSIHCFLFLFLQVEMRKRQQSRVCIQGKRCWSQETFSKIYSLLSLKEQFVFSGRR